MECMRWLFLREIRKIVQSRSEEPDFELDQDTRRQIVEAVDRFVKKYELNVYSYLTDDLETRIRHGVSVLPLEDIEILNQVRYKGKLFQKSAHYASNSMLYSIAGLYEVAAARHGGIRNWSEMTADYTAQKKEADAMRSRESRVRWNKRGEWLVENAPLVAAGLWCAVLGTHDFYKDWVYQISRWGICGACFWRGGTLWNLGWRRSLLPLAAVAVLFNPLAPIDFSRSE